MSWSAADATELREASVSSIKMPGTAMIRARRLQDVRLEPIADFFPDVADGDVISVTIDENVPEGCIELVYRLPVAK